MTAPELLMQKAAGENFPVASRFLPRAVRSHLMAVYGFARLVDDTADDAPGDRLEQLDLIEHDLKRIWSGVPEHPVLFTLARTVDDCDLPPEPFLDLIAAGRQDQSVSSYSTFDDLLAYCELSAKPVGRLILGILGVATPERLRLGDDISTGLQLTEHWQDVREDLERGRVYLPEEDMRRFGCERSDLEAATASERLRRLIGFEVARARSYLDAGAPLIATLRGRRALAMAGFIGGGRAALTAIENAGCDVIGGRPRPSRSTRVRLVLAALTEAARRQ